MPPQTRAPIFTHRNKKYQKSLIFLGQSYSIITPSQTYFYEQTTAHTLPIGHMDKVKFRSTFLCMGEAAVSPPVSRNDKAADCQVGNNDSCTPQLLGTSTRSHLPRHPTGTSHYSTCQDICHWDSLLFPLPSGKATYTYLHSHCGPG